MPAAMCWHTGRTICKVYNLIRPLEKRIIKPSFVHTQRFGLNRRHPLVLGLKAAWFLNEQAGEHTYDLSGYRHNGTFFHDSFDPLWGQVKDTDIGQSVNIGLQLDADVVTGSSVRMDADYSDLKIFGTGQSITLAARVYIEALITGWNRIVCKRNTGGGNDEYGLMMSDSSGRLTARWGGSDDHSTANSDVLNRPVHLMATFDGTDKTNFYQDGIKLGATVTAARTINDSTVVVCLGERFAQDRYLRGWIEYAFIWDRELSAAEALLVAQNPYAIAYHPQVNQQFFVAAGVGADITKEITAAYQFVNA